MTITFTQKNNFIPEDQIGVAIAARFVKDPFNFDRMTLEISLYDGRAPLQVGSIRDMPCMIKGSEEDVERLKSMGFNSSPGIWGVLS